MTDEQMEQKGLVSVIIPVYNVEKYLDECVQSVLNQTYQNLEIILVDDGSTDRSGLMCDEYSAKCGAIVVHQSNRGLSGARNAGLALAKGEYVYFLDSDDWIEKNAIDSLYRCATENQADLVFFEANTFVDSAGQRTQQNYLRTQSYSAGTGEAVFAILQQNGEFHPSVPLLFLRRSFLQNADLRFTEGIVYEDMLYTVIAFFRAKVVAHCHKVLYQRRLRPNSTVTSRPGKHHFESICTVLRQLDEWQEQEHIQSAALSAHIARCGYRAMGLFSQLEMADKRNCRSKYKEIRKLIRQRRGYGNRLLVLRTYGMLPWVLGKLWEKLFSSRRSMQ